MNKLPTTFARLAAAGLLVLAAGSAQARPPHGGGPFGYDLFKVERLAAELELDSAQRAAFERIVDEGREQARPHVQRMIANHEAMKALTRADTLDEGAIRAQAEANGKVMAELAVIHARGRHALRALLTPEQRAKLEREGDRRGFDAHE